MSESLECTVCGESHDWPALFLHYPLPRAALEVPELARASRVQVDAERGHCVIDGRRAFLQGELDLPIQDSSRKVTFKTWTQVAMTQARWLADRWRSRLPQELPPIAAAMTDSLPGYPETRGIRVLLDAPSSEIRPKIQVLENPNPLYRDQRRGLGPSRLREIASHLHHAR